MSDQVARIQEDLQEATFAAMREALELARAWYAEYSDEVHDPAGGPGDACGVNVATGIRDALDGALQPEAGRTFLGHMQRLEAENATLREDVVRFLAENARIRGLLAHFEHCPHGCQDAGFCPHYAKVRQLGLRL